jgi:hypothetical protein
VGRKSPLMAVVFSCGVLLGAAVGLASCGSQIAIEPSAEQSTTTAVSQASTTIAGITTSSSLPVIELMGDPKLDYLHPEYSYKLADAVVLATVTCPSVKTPSPTSRMTRTVLSISPSSTRDTCSRSKGLSVPIQSRQRSLFLREATAPSSSMESPMRFGTTFLWMPASASDCSFR